MARQFFTGVKITAGDENTLYLDTGTTGHQTTIFYQVDGSYKYQQRVGTNWELYNYTRSNWDFHIQGSTGRFGLGHNDPRARLHLSGDNSERSAIRQSRTGVVIWDQAIDSSGRLQWGTRGSEGGTRSVHFTLDDNSKAGVGIESPDSKFHVEQAPVTLNTTNLDNSSAVALSLTIPDATLSGGEGIALALGMNGRGRSYIATEFDSSNKDATDLVFYTENGGTIVERMRIDQTGLVGIGTTPASGMELHVNGNIRVDASDGIKARGIQADYFSSGQDMSIKSGNSGDVILGDSSAARLTLASDDSATFAGIVSVPTGKTFRLYNAAGTGWGEIGLEESENKIQFNRGIKPSGNNQSDQTLGTSTKRWHTLYAGAGSFSGSVHLDSDSAQLQLGDDNDMQIYHNGADGEINIATGHFIIDSAGDITLDAAGNDIRLFKAGVEYGKFKSDSSDLALYSSVENKDMLFRGNDGGTTIDALTLDMSDEGTATFLKALQVGSGSGNGYVSIGTGYATTSALTIHSISTSSQQSAINIIQNGGSGNPIIRMGEKSTDGGRFHMFDANVEKVAFYTDGTANHISAGDVYIGTASGNGKLDVHAPSGRWRVNNYGGMYFRNDSNSTHESYIHPRSDGSLSIGRVAESDWSQTGSNAFASTTYDHLTFATNSNATFAGNIRTTEDIGRDDHNRIMFSTDDSIIFRVADSHRFRMDSDNFSPYVDSSYDLGTTSKYFRAAYIDAITTTGNVTIGGDLQVNGTTTTVNSTNLDLSDNIIGLNRGLTGTNANDAGIIIERGSSGDNAAFIWDESIGYFSFGTTQKTPAATGAVSNESDWSWKPIKAGGAVFTEDITVGALTSGQTAQLTVNNEGGVPSIARFKSRTNKAHIEISDNDTTGYISSENGLFSIGRNAGVNAAHININASNQVLIGASTTSFNDKLYLTGDAYINGALRIGTAATYVGKMFNDSGKLTFQSDGDRDIQIGSSNNDDVIVIDTSAQSTTFSGVVNVEQGAVNLLTLTNTTNGGGAGMVFNDNNGGAQRIYLRGYHADGSSQGGGASLHLQSTENDLVFVVGDSSNTGRLVVQSAHSSSEVDYGFYSDTNTGMYSPAADQVGLVAGGSRKLLVTSAGVNVQNGDLAVSGDLSIKGATMQAYHQFNSDPITSSDANNLFSVGGQGMVAGYSRNISIWSTTVGTWRSWVGTNLRWDGTNYKRASNAANNNWGNVAGIEFKGGSSGSDKTISFYVDEPENSSGGDTDGTVGTSIPSAWTAFQIDNNRKLYGYNNMYLGSYSYFGAAYYSQSNTAYYVDPDGTSVVNKVNIGVHWDSGTLENNAIYAKNSTDGFGFGNGTGISTWWAWSTESGLRRMIDVANSGSYIDLRTGNSDRVRIDSEGLTVKNNGDVRLYTSGSQVRVGSFTSGSSNNGEYADDDIVVGDGSISIYPHRRGDYSLDATTATSTTFRSKLNIWSDNEDHITFGGASTHMVSAWESWKMWINNDSTSAGTLHLYNKSSKTEFARFSGDASSSFILGDFKATGSLRGTIFYDHNDTGYYVNPASTSVVNTVQASYFKASTASTSDPILRLTDTGVANYDVVFPDTNTYRLETSTSSTKTFRLYNAGSGSFKMQADEFVKTGGTSSQYLMADGSVSTGGVSGVDGSGAANRLAIWSDADSLTSNVNITVSSGQLNLGNGLLVEDNDTTVITAKAYEPHIVWQKTRGSSGDDYFKIKAENDAMCVDFTAARDGGSDTRVLRIDNNNRFIFSTDGQYNVLHTSLMSVYGRLTSSSDIRSTQYYDYNDTAKYIDLNSTGTSLTANGTIHASNSNMSSYQLNGTYVMDSSRNLVNIGTIGSGAITSSGNVQHTGLTMTSGTDVDQVKEFTMSFQLAANTWTDTGIDGSDLATGTYAMQVYVDDHSVGGSHYDEYYSGMMSWFGGGTNETAHATDEIPVHRAGHAPNDGNIQFRTKRGASADLKLQVKHNEAYSAALNNSNDKKMTFKFRRLI